MQRTRLQPKNQTVPHAARLVVEVSAARRFVGLNRRWLAARTRAACRVLGVQSGEISIRLADDAEMSHLHEQHKGIAGPTDVLTFDFQRPHAGKEGRCHLEAEIVIDGQVAQRQARSRHHEPGAEAMLYIVHGLLHCLGHDDHEPTQAAAMHRREDATLRRIGVGPAYRARGDRVFG